MQIERHQIIAFFEDGNQVFSWINGTKQEVESYYVGQFFTFGTCEANERKVKCVSVKFL